MYISRVQLRNYRNFQSSELTFEKGVNTIIGENGSGKTNFFQALRVLFDDSLPRNFRFFESDFSRGLSGMGWKGHWIILSVDFLEMDSSDESQMLTCHSAGYAETEPVEKKGRYSLIFRPNIAFRKKLFALSNDQSKDESKLSDLLANLSINDYEFISRYKGSADFTDDLSYAAIVGDFEKIIFPDPDQELFHILGDKSHRSLNIFEFISCTFVKALRDVESDLRSYSNNPVLNLLRDREKNVDVNFLENIYKDVSSLNHKISSLDEVLNIQHGVSREIQKSVGSVYSPNIEIGADIPRELSKLFQSLKIKVGDPDDVGYRGRLSELSLGGANIIFFALKLMEYSEIKDHKSMNILLIEEPEAHIHTHIQKTLFSNLDDNKTQIFVSTHSTHIYSVSKIKSVNVLSRKRNCVEVCSPAKGLTDEEVRKLSRYLDAIRSNLLFAKGVILVEGDAESILIPNIFKVKFGLSLDEVGISIVNIGSTGFENVAKIFHQDRLRKNCSIITDNDLAFIDLASIPEFDNKTQKKARASQTSGEGRKKRLSDFTQDNPYIKCFFATHTFEVDLIAAGNNSFFVEAVDKIYADPITIQTKKEELNSDKNFEKFNCALSLADYRGKGWFALDLVDLITEDFVIPDYIMEAIYFAMPEVTEKMARSIVEKRAEVLGTVVSSFDRNTIISVFKNDPVLLLLKGFLNDYS